jgi:sugar phosphate isomerase/epimerase
MSHLKQFVYLAVILLGCFILRSCKPTEEKGNGFKNLFYAMDTGTDSSNKTVKEQVAMVKALGYDGISYDIGAKDWLNGLKEMIAETKNADYKLIEVYFEITVNADTQSYSEPKIHQAIELLKGTDTILFLTLMSDTYGPSDPEGDAAGVNVLRQIADEADQAGLKIAIYQHTGCWAQSAQDAIRLVEKVDRKNVGISFNLCHTLMVDGPDKVVPLAKSALPHLFAVTINGADADGKEWGVLIQNLGQGSYDVYPLLKTLHDLDFTGPIGLQGYGIGGDAQENLSRSITAWRNLSRKIAASN